MKRILGLIFVSIVVASVLALVLRADTGNITEKTVGSQSYRDDSALELSHERGYFALTYSMIEKHSFSFSVPFARFIVPDVVYQNGEYKSIFPPGVSFIIVPGYVIGKALHNSLVGATAMVALFALVNFFLIYAITKSLGINTYAALLAAFIFLFATPAFSYAGSIYQHHVTVCLLLACVYLLQKYRSALSLGVVWLLVGSSILVDYPNAYFMIPIALFALTRMVSVIKQRSNFVLSIYYRRILSGLFVLIPAALLMWYNASAYGSPLQLAGTLSRVESVDQSGGPVSLITVKGKVVNVFKTVEHIEVQGAGGTFFSTRSILNGLYIHFLSPDRGLIYFSPVLLLAFFGVVYSKYHKQSTVVLLSAIAGVNIVLYSMWGDPWGGWAFGSRYLIPSYAVASIFVAMLLQQYRKRAVFILVFSVLLWYSLAVNTLGAVTSNKMPPQIEVQQLEKDTHVKQKYTYMRDVDYLYSTGSKSVLYTSFVSHMMSAPAYYASIAGGLGVFSVILLGMLYNVSAFMPWKVLGIKRAFAQAASSPIFSFKKKQTVVRSSRVRNRKKVALKKGGIIFEK